MTTYIYELLIDSEITIQITLCNYTVIYTLYK